jgi:hypothetical protein
MRDRYDRRNGFSISCYPVGRRAESESVTPESPDKRRRNAGKMLNKSKIKATISLK